jgi:HPt (histidine-containing phosphotransfer) domain-containing protein
MGPRVLRTPAGRVGTAPEAAIDLGYLSRFTLGNWALTREVLELFAAQAPQCLERLRSAASDREWKQAAHALKGSAAAVGAKELMRLAELAERLDGTLSAAEREGAVAAIAEATEAARRQIARLV